jgi:hypothetical protein
MKHFFLMAFPVAVVIASMRWVSLSPMQRDCLKVAWGAALLIMLTVPDWSQVL